MKKLTKARKKKPVKRGGVSRRSVGVETRNHSPDNYREVLETAQFVALALGKKSGEITVEDVQVVLDKMGVGCLNAGQASAVFSGRFWEKTGETKPAVLPHSKKRHVQVWRYTEGKRKS